MAASRPRRAVAEVEYEEDDEFELDNEKYTVITTGDQVESGVIFSLLPLSLLMYSHFQVET